MGKDFNSLSYLTTTGTGIAIGGKGSIMFGGAFRTTTATTLTVKDSAGSSVLVLSADAAVVLPIPIAMKGPATMTSSGGTPTVIFRQLT